MRNFIPKPRSEIFFVHRKCIILAIYREILDIISDNLIVTSMRKKVWQALDYPKFSSPYFRLRFSSLWFEKISFCPSRIIRQNNRTSFRKKKKIYAKSKSKVKVPDISGWSEKWKNFWDNRICNRTPDYVKFRFWNFTCSQKLLQVYIFSSLSSLMFFIYLYVYNYFQDIYIYIGNIYIFIYIGNCTITVS